MAAKAAMPKRPRGRPRKVRPEEAATQAAAAAATTTTTTQQPPPPQTTIAPAAIAGPSTSAPTV